MGFRNAIVSGLTLVREAIQSVGYVPGSSGWAINRDGSAEFSDATVRGELDVSSPSGQHVRINSSGLFPQIEFSSADGTKKAFINAAADLEAAGDRAWLGLNPSSKIDSDAVERTARLWLLGSEARLEVIQSSSQTFDGGHLSLDKDQVFMGTGTFEARAAIQIARIYVLLRGQPFVSADAVTRLAREFIQNDTLRLEILKNDTLQNDGGKVLLQRDQAIIGYHDVDGGIDNRIALFNSGITLTATDGVIHFITDVPTTSSRLLRDSKSILPNVEMASVNIALTKAATSTGYGTITGLSFSFTKNHSDTRLIGYLSVGGFLTGAGNSSFEFAIRINNADHSVFIFPINPIGEQFFRSGEVEIPAASVPAGTYTVTCRWRGTFGTGTLDAGGNRYIMRLMEVAP